MHACRSDIINSPPLIIPVPPPICTLERKVPPLIFTVPRTTYRLYVESVNVPFSIVTTAVRDVSHIHIPQYFPLMVPLSIVSATGPLIYILSFIVADSILFPMLRVYSPPRYVIFPFFTSKGSASASFRSSITAVFPSASANAPSTVV